MLKIVNDPAIASLQASKWQHLQMLVSKKELAALFSFLGSFHIYRIGQVLSLDRVSVEISDYLNIYSQYIEDLQKEQALNSNYYKKELSVIFSKTPEAVFLYQIKENEYLTRIKQPVIQLQAHFLHYSECEKKIRSMVFGPDCISWGIQFSYPQLYQDRESMQILKANDVHSCENAQLFKNLQQWTRKETIPTKFYVDGTSIVSSVRLGKQALAYTKNHFGMRSKAIEVDVK